MQASAAAYVSLKKAPPLESALRTSHLALKAPKPAATISIRKKYPGKVVYAHGADGQVMLIQTAFPTMPAHDSFESNIRQFLEDHPGEPGKVYKFEGAYMLFKNGHPSFSGHLKEVEL